MSKHLWQLKWGDALIMGIKSWVLTAEWVTSNNPQPKWHAKLPFASGISIGFEFVRALLTYRSSIWVLRRVWYWVPSCAPWLEEKWHAQLGTNGFEIGQKNSFVGTHLLLWRVPSPPVCIINIILMKIQALIWWAMEHTVYCIPDSKALRHVVTHLKLLLYFGRVCFLWLPCKW